MISEREIEKCGFLVEEREREREREREIILENNKKNYFNKA